MVLVLLASLMSAQGFKQLFPFRGIRCFQRIGQFAGSLFKRKRVGPLAVDHHIEQRVQGDRQTLGEDATIGLQDLDELVQQALRAFAANALDHCRKGLSDGTGVLRKDFVLQVVQRLFAGRVVF